MTSLMGDEARAANHGLLVDELSPGSWRLCDPGRPGHDAEHVLAYIERGAAGRLDVVWLLGAPRRESHDQWDAVFLAADERRVEGSRGADRPVEIASRAPATDVIPLVPVAAASADDRCDP